MDLKRIGRFCKRAKKITIIRSAKKGALWVGDGRGMWLCDEGVHIDRDNAASMLDIDVDTLEKTIVREGDTENEIFDCMESGVFRRRAEEFGAVMHCGELMVIIRALGDTRVAMIPQEYAKAAVKKDEYLQYYILGPEESPVVAVTDGIFVKMLLMVENRTSTMAMIQWAEQICENTPYGIAPTTEEQIGMFNESEEARV